MNADEDCERARAAFHDFALACRAERDRVALLRLAREDRRFNSDSAERAAAEQLAARLIAAIAR